MAAHHHLGHQFRKQMRPGEIKGLVSGSADLWQGETMEDMWEGKEFNFGLSPSNPESRADLYEDIREHGVQSPVELIANKQGRSWSFSMGEGHHRVAAAHMLEEETGQEYPLPVSYSFPGGQYEDEHSGVE